MKKVITRKRIRNNNVYCGVCVPSENCDCACACASLMGEDISRERIKDIMKSYCKSI